LHDLKPTLSPAFASSWHGVTRIRNPPLSQSRQDLFDPARYPRDNENALPADLILHPAANAPADKQLDRQLLKAFRPGHTWYERPVLVLHELMLLRILQENQHPPAAVENRGHSALMFRDGQSHGCTCPLFINFHANQGRDIKGLILLCAIACEHSHLLHTALLLE
jgi:hypothetical protein